MYVTYQPRLRTWRMLRNLSQQELSRLSGVSQATISLIETGKKRDPRIGTLLPLSRVLDVPVDDLFEVEVHQVHAVT